MTPETRAELLALAPSSADPKKRTRLNVSLPRHLSRWAREQAAEAGVPVSRVVELAIRRRMAAE